MTEVSRPRRIGGTRPPGHRFAAISSTIATDPWVDRHDLEGD